jgi:hypothetical protein
VEVEALLAAPRIIQDTARAKIEKTMNNTMSQTRNPASGVALEAENNQARTVAATAIILT